MLSISLQNLSTLSTKNKLKAFGEPFKKLVAHSKAKKGYSVKEGKRKPFGKWTSLIEDRRPLENQVQGDFLGFRTETSNVGKAVKGIPLGGGGGVRWEWDECVWKATKRFFFFFFFCNILFCLLFFFPTQGTFSNFVLDPVFVPLSTLTCS